jgi:phosphatidylglycerol:prolipoprotein diacylglycerol transferase
VIRYPDVDPVAFSIGGFSVHWYGLMYLFGFLAGWKLGRIRAAGKGSGWTASMVDDLVTWAMLGVILGARLGFVLFYDLAHYLNEPLEIFSLWRGGMSFHGGLLGVLAAVWLFARKRGLRFLAVVDFVAPLIPPGLFFGRIGNFINAELWGRPTDAWWGVVFPGAGPLPRHPSQLYEAGLEGLVLFAAVWLFSSKARPVGRVSGMFAVGYAVCRFLVEYVRQPDAHIGYLAFGWLTMGQALCLPLLLAGLWLLLRRIGPA